MRRSNVLRAFRYRSLALDKLKQQTWRKHEVLPDNGARLTASRRSYASLSSSSPTRRENKLKCLSLANF
jgi:hypothetical protein